MTTSIFLSPESALFGYHLQQPYQEEYIQDPYFIKFVNWTNFTGSIPFISIITAFVLWKFSETHLTYPVKYDAEVFDLVKRCRMIVFTRMIAAIFCVGFLFLIPDIIFTIGRKYQLDQGNYVSHGDSQK